jgi:long-chain-acyl-CoA dehydrogenase
MEQHLYEPVHGEFRALCREFLAREAVPHHADWEKAGIVDREVWRKAGAAGLLGLDVDEEFGGGGQRDFRFNAVLVEEVVRAGCSGLGFGLHNDVVAPYLTDLTTDEQRKRWLPGFCRGDIITAIAMSEPGAGSDLAGVTTAAVRDDDEYVITGQKIFVGSDHGADRIWMIVCTKPGGTRHENLSWFMIDANLPGITVQPMELMGTGGEGGTDPVQKNTVFFDQVRVPAFSLVGGENHGWKAASTHLELEHGAGGRIGRHRVWDRLLAYCQQTKRDGIPLTQHPDTRDLLADVYIKTEVQRLFGLRNFWLTYAKRPRSYEGPQLSYYRKMAGLWMTGAILEAVGPAALTSDSTWGSSDGFLELQQRNGIVAVHPGGTADIQRVSMARRIGIGRAAREAAGTVH